MIDAKKLRELAARVLAEEPSDQLRIAVMEAIGQPACEPAIEEDGTPSGFVFLECDPLTSHDAAFAAMPAGWILLCVTQTRTELSVSAHNPNRSLTIIRATCTDLPSALTAAGLLARDVEAEQKETT